MPPWGWAPPAKAAKDQLGFLLLCSALQDDSKVFRIPCLDHFPLELEYDGETFPLLLALSKTHQKRVRMKAKPVCLFPALLGLTPAPVCGGSVHVDHPFLSCQPHLPTFYSFFRGATHSVMSDALRSQGLYSSWNSPGHNTGVGSLSLLQGIFPSQGLNPGLPHCRWILYQLSHLGSLHSFTQDFILQDSLNPICFARIFPFITLFPPLVFHCPYDLSQNLSFESLFICLFFFLAVWGLRCYKWAFSSCGALASHCCGFSSCRAWALGRVGFGSCGAWVQLPCGTWDLLDQGLNSCPLHWQEDC